MKRFRYSLDHLLSLRRHSEREAEMAMAEVIARRNAAERRRRELVSERERPIGRQPDGALDLSFELVRSRYLDRIEFALKSTRDELNRMDRDLENARDEYNERRRAREVLERLKEVREVEHYRGERRRADAELNDIIGSRAARERAEGAL